MEPSQAASATPIYDGVLGDRLAAARAAVDRAGRDAEQFRTALDAGTAAALEQQAQQRAEQLVTERTAALTARVAVLERLLREAQDQLAATTAAAVPEPAPEPNLPEVTPEPVTPEPVTPKPESEPEPEVEPDPEPDHDAEPEPEPEVEPEPVEEERPGRRARDEGPTGADIPSVPSMKDIFASTRASGWLDSLLGGKR